MAVYKISLILYKSERELKNAFNCGAYQRIKNKTKSKCACAHTDTNTQFKLYSSGLGLDSRKQFYQKFSGLQDTNSPLTFNQSVYYLEIPNIGASILQQALRDNERESIWEGTE